MARRKKKALTKASTTTPASKDKANSRIEFHKRIISRECQKRIDELVSNGEQMIKRNKEAELEFLSTIPIHIGNMKLADFFQAGYMLDYHYESVGEKFVSISPCHFDIRDTSTAQTTKNRTTGVLRNANNTLLNTPAAGAQKIPSNNGLLITPKVVLQPKRGQIVVYSENGSPYVLNLKTMHATKALDTADSGPTPSTSTRSTRATRRNP